MAGHVHEFLSPVQVASKDTLYSRAIQRDRIDLPKVDLVIIDEAHLSISRTWCQLIMAYAEMPTTRAIIGLTATPIRSDGRGLGLLYHDMVLGTSIEEQIDAGLMVPTRMFSPPAAQPNLQGCARGGADGFQISGERGVECRVMQEGLVGDIFHNWKKVAGDRPTVVFASSIKHSLYVKNVFSAQGVVCEHVDGNTPKDERDSIARAVANGDIQVVTNAQVFSYGWDCPPISCCVVACPCRTLAGWLQRVGRVCRSSPGKTDCIVLDHSGCSAYHGHPEDTVEWTLESSGNIQDTIQQQRESEKNPRECHACGFHWRTQSIACPECGTMPKPRKGTLISVRPGELTEVQRQKKARKLASQSELQQSWDSIVWEVAEKDQRIGSAYYKYRNKWGVGPNHNLKRVPRSGQWKMDARDFCSAVGLNPR
jgi:superfamily II DNA or RNA helicase